MRDNAFDMKRFVCIFLLAAVLGVWMPGAGAHVPEDWRSDSVISVRNFRQIDTELGTQKTLVPGLENKWIICRNDPINYFDPDGRDVYNATDHTIYVKPEIGNDAIPVYSGKTYFGEQDGICDPLARPGEVYKNTDGIDMQVHPDGDIRKYGGTIKETWKDFLGGGWKNSKWLKKRHDKKDKGWDNLFKKAKDPASALVKDLKKEIKKKLEANLESIGNRPIENASIDDSDIAE